MMLKRIFFVSFIISILFVAASVFAQEAEVAADYPAAYGKYEQGLQSEKLTLGYSATQPGILTVEGSQAAPSASAGSIRYNTTPGAKRFQYTAVDVAANNTTDWQDFGGKLTAITRELPLCTDHEEDPPGTPTLDSEGNWIYIPKIVVDQNDVVGEAFEIDVSGAQIGNKVVLGPPADWTPGADFECHGFFAWVSGVNKVKVSFLKKDIGSHKNDAGKINCGPDYQWKITLLE